PQRAANAAIIGDAATASFTSRSALLDGSGPHQPLAEENHRREYPPILHHGGRGAQIRAAPARDRARKAAPVYHLLPAEAVRGRGVSSTPREAQARGGDGRSPAA